MEEDEDIKKSVEKQENYDEFNIKDLLDEINSLKKKLKFLENLLKNKISGQNEAKKLFKLELNSFPT